MIATTWEGEREGSTVRQVNEWAIANVRRRRLDWLRWWWWWVQNERGGGGGHTVKIIKMVNVY